MRAGAPGRHYDSHPMLYAAEAFTAEEAAKLRPYFTNLDRPVFALTNLPEVVKGALFARYSRSDKSLRRLFLDEFVADLDLTGDLTVDATVGLKRDGAVIDGELPVAEIARRLSLGTRSKLDVKVEGASWSWPTTRCTCSAAESSASPRIRSTTRATSARIRVR